MTRPMTREARKAAMLGLMSRLVDEMEAWYEAHPGASFEELEAAARPRRRALMGQVLGVLVNGRGTGQQAEVPRCGGCEGPLAFKGYRPRTITGLEGDSTLERAYYVCPDCEGQALFPPGSATQVARR